MSTKQPLLDQAEQLHRHNRQGSYGTRRRYDEAFKRFCVFLAEWYRLKLLKNIAPKHVYAYVEDMKERGLSPATIKTELSAIRFCHDKIDDAKNKLPENSELDLERRSFGKVDRSWSQREVMRFLAVCCKLDRRDYIAVAAIAYYAGFRISECFKIDTAIAEAAIRTGALTIKGKGGKFRTVPVGTEITDKLAEFLAAKRRNPSEAQRSGFARKEDEQRSGRNFVPRKTELSLAQFVRTRHGLRHSYAARKYTEFRATGKTDAEAKNAVSQLLGHNRPKVTNNYLAGLKKGGDGNV